jgi:hypothetical protein
MMVKRPVPEAWVPSGHLDVSRDENLGVILSADHPGPAGLAVLDLGSLSLQVDRADIGRLVSILIDPGPEGLDSSQREVLRVIVGEQSLALLEDVMSSSQLKDATQIEVQDTQELRAVRLRLSFLALLEELRIGRWPDEPSSHWWSAEFCRWAKGIPLNVIERRARTEAQVCAEAWRDLSVSALSPETLDPLISAAEALNDMWLTSSGTRVMNFPKQRPSMATPEVSRYGRMYLSQRPSSTPVSGREQDRRRHSRSSLSRSSTRPGPHFLSRRWKPILSGMEFDPSMAVS